MKIYHRTGLAEAKCIIEFRKIFASDRERGSEIHAGPFFFIEDEEEDEVARNPASDQMKLIFECDLPPLHVFRNSEHLTNLIYKNIDHLLGKLILEENPHRPGRVTQARIIAPNPDGLRIVDYESKASMSKKDKLFFDKAKLERYAIAVCSRKG